MPSGLFGGEAFEGEMPFSATGASFVKQHARLSLRIGALFPLTLLATLDTLPAFGGTLLTAACWNALLLTTPTSSRSGPLSPWVLCGAFVIAAIVFALIALPSLADETLSGLRADVRTPPDDD